ncbi:MAG: hypothetical protein IJM76_10200 [Lachnospiraceae bacterium]|nr:hypothetical protein [Lachnospiraceae bacterium]
MSGVSTSSEAIGEAVKNVTEALTSVHETSGSLKRKCQELGQGWKDSKYQELNATVQECLKALSQVQHALMDGGKKLSALAKTVMAYEDVNMGTGSGGARGGNGTGAAVAAGAVGVAAGVMLGAAMNRNGAVGAAAELLERAAGAGDADDPPKVLKKTDAQKMADLKSGLANIDETLENYAANLADQGIPRGPAVEAFLNHQRALMEAELLRNMNGDFSHPYVSPQPGQWAGIAEQFRRSGILNAPAPNTTPRSLQHTAYGFQTQTINGTEMRVYDDPVGTHQRLIQRQGQSVYDMRGTCGLCQCSNMLTLAGIEGYNEERIISEGLRCSDTVCNNIDPFNRNNSHRGGTSADDRREILSNCGLPTYCMHMSSDRALNIGRIAEAVRTGHGVTVSVDVARLWHNGQHGGHAITILSVSEDGNTFIYNDTGAGVLGTIDASALGGALTGNPANVTRDIIR